MSGFDLIPEHGGDPIHLPPGETLLGRGPFLGVSDKRVSRRHGLLDNNNGQLRLKPTHLNPCFLQSSLNDDPRPLQKGVWCALRHGDVLSLLPGQLLYRVVALSPLRGGAALEPQPLPVSPQTTPLLDGDAAPDGTSKKEVEVASPSPRLQKRVLPAWMMALTASSASCSPQGTAKAKKASPTGSLPGEAELSEDEEKPKVKRRRKDGGLKTDVPPSHQRPVSSPQKDMADARLQVVSSGVDQSQSEETNGSGDKQSAKQRSPCPYGKDCYRKNPLHFRESSHPGDSDYEEEEQREAEEEERPQCPYGADCYRKNPLHRKEYTHARRAARSTRAPPRRTADEDESEDSFIDDDSEDAGDDADYAPPDSDSDGDEGVAQLRKEAAAFVRGRK
ncbi:aprataxin and PNK-like factor isoform X1 [Entelurus aequoreus]|uniref:aprataxin and PNK-like factor isoform X1 n=1 Tax=Entelurus aequoreus TaxID=161455 RepID=UPI002B1D4B2E|nr:aprataxin and PNK-like factor isoform X1 [Entelurus aequoreus]